MIEAVLAWALVAYVLPEAIIGMVFLTLFVMASYVAAAPFVLVFVLVMSWLGKCP